MKICNICNDFKELSNFYKCGFNRKKKEHKYRAYCKDCTPWDVKLMGLISTRLSPSSNPKGKIIKKENSTEQITIDDIRSLRIKQKDKCYWLGVDIDFTYKDVLRKPSLDRLDNSKGYELGNVVLTTIFANTGRLDASIDEMNSFIKDYLKP